MPLKDQDKVAWGWTEHTDPKEITNDHIFTAYRIKQNFCRNKTCRRNCRGNPFCLSGLGEARLIENLNNVTDDTTNTLPKRAVGNFVGLKNLGATCYVNSLLQLWFHNKAFRDAIFSWNPWEDPVEQTNSSLNSDEPYLPLTVVGHLQQLFALMYYSKCRYIDPSPLVGSLRLDTSTQQDAQEFSKLLVSLIENTLRHQSLQNVKNLISDNFKGEYVYVTRCCKCLTESVSPSMFYELELNVKGHNTLTECLAEFLQEEKLEGADCYSCTVCQDKQEACRFIKLCSLPPILNLQLLRFVYDREKGQRKKLKSVVQFPETLDMKEFVETEGEESLLYNLSAVLIHKGARASSGHFIAYIKDGLTGVWNMFNDESVEKLEGKRLKLDEEDPENPKKAKVPKLPKGCQSSTDAYMLVYTSEKHKPNLNEVQLSSKLQAYVDSQNNIFDEFCEEIIVSKKEGLDRQEQLLNVYKSLSVDGADDLNDIDVLSVDWLTAWLDNKIDCCQQIDNYKLICPHGKLDPCAVTSAKYVSATAADSLYDCYGGGPRLKMSNVLCESCVVCNCFVFRIKTKTLEESKEISNLLKKRMSLDEPGFYVSKYSLKTWRTKVLNMIESKNRLSEKNSARVGSSVNDEASESMTEETIPASQSSSVKSEKDKDESEVVECNIPPRKKLFRNRPMNTLQKRKQSRTITVPLREIRNCFVLCTKLHVELNKPNNSNELNGSRPTLLDQCNKLKVKLKRLTHPYKNTRVLNSPRKNSPEKKKDNKIDDNHIEQNIERKADFENNGENSQPSDNSENTAVKQEDEEAIKSDDGINLKKEFNEAIMCPHGNLSIEESERKLVPVRIWEILKQYFPSAPSFLHDAEPCRQCQNLASKDEVVKQHYYESALNQKKMLADLFSLRNRPVPGKTEDIIFILHKQHFHQPWSVFLRSSTKRDGGTMVEPPVNLKVEMLLCVHGLLHYSPEYDEDLARLVLVTSQEWETLTRLYTTDLQVTLTPDFNTNPEVCQSCFSARIENEQKEKLNYDRARLNIRQVPSASSLDDQESSDSGPSYKRPRIGDNSNRPTTPIPPEYKKIMKNLTANGSAPSDVRRSARRRKVPGQKDVHFMVSSTLTLRELKQMITGQLAVAPFDQHLITLEGKELHGDYNTLSSLGILPNTTLLLQVDEPKETLDDTLEECSQATEPETGFKGTGLLHAY